LIIIAFDANNRIFLLAFAIFDEEKITIEDDFFFAYKNTLLVVKLMYI
jgi:hypothetical protein